MVPRALGGTPAGADAGYMRRLSRDDGQTIVEYGMVLAGVSVVLITFFIVIDLGSVFTTLVDNIEAAFS
jgi:Flp pilus assembly pilin Flp